MAVRIQFRRGTAAEWTSANTVLAAGELGYETDTAKFKLGDGSTAWSSLNYAGINQTDIDSAVANVIDMAPTTLDTLNELAASIGDDSDFANTVASNIETAIAIHRDDTTNIHGIADTADLETQSGAQTKADNAEANAASYTDTAVANLVDSAPGTLDTLNELATALGDDPNFSTTISTSLSERLKFVIDTSSNLNTANAVTAANTIYIESDVPGYVRIGDGVTAYADVPITGADYADLAITDHNNTTTGVHGIANTEALALSADVTQEITDAVDAHSDITANVHGIANTLALITDAEATAKVSTHNSQTENVHGIDDTTDLAKLSGSAFTGDVSFGGSVTVGNISDAELNYLDGVTSSIQTQLDDINTDLDAKANLAGPVFTGTVSLPETTSIGNVSATEIGYLDGVTSGVQGQIDQLNTNKAPSQDPSFSGIVVLPSTTSIGSVDATEISHLNGITSSVQGQLDSKANLTGGATFTGTVSLPATTSIGNVSATELQHLANVTSDVQAQIDTKAPIDSPTFTGTVSGVTATMVGLGSVNNTADLEKPVSNATQNALDVKVDLAGGTMTGFLTLNADPTQALHAATKEYVDNVSAGLNTKPQVEAATTANLSGTYDNGTAGVGATLNLGQLATLDIDGHTSWDLLDGILVKDQTNAFENGRYVVDQIGNDTDTDWIIRRCSLCDTSDEVPGMYIFVVDGSTNAQTGWVAYVDDPDTFTVGTDDIDFSQFSGAGTVTAGTNIDVNGQQVSLVADPTLSDATITNLDVTNATFADGTVQTSAGVPSLTSFTEKTASYTLDTLDHQDNVVEVNSSSATTFTIPTDAALSWPVGASMDIFQLGTGQVTIEGDSGVTVLFTPGNKLRTQYSSCTIMKRAANSWVLYGDLTA